MRDKPLVMWSLGLPTATAQLTTPLQCCLDGFDCAVLASLLVSRLGIVLLHFSWEPRWCLTSALDMICCYNLQLHTGPAAAPSRMLLKLTSLLVVRQKVQLKRLRCSTTAGGTGTNARGSDMHQTIYSCYSTALTDHTNSCCRCVSCAMPNEPGLGSQTGWLTLM